MQFHQDQGVYLETVAERRHSFLQCYTFLEQLGWGKHWGRYSYLQVHICKNFFLTVRRIMANGSIVQRMPRSSLKFPNCPIATMGWSTGISLRRFSISNHAQFLNAEHICPPCDDGTLPWGTQPSLCFATRNNSEHVPCADHRYDNIPSESCQWDTDYVTQNPKLKVESCSKSESPSQIISF